jgi:predicted O-methyltransferase YrrM
VFNSKRRPRYVPLTADGVALFDKLTADGSWYLGYPTGVTKERGLVLYGVVRALRPRYVIETGTASGVSTTFIGAALLDNGAGELYSIDLPQEEAVRRYERYRVAYDAQRGPGWAIPDDIRDGMGERLHLVLEDVATALPALLAQLPHVDVFFHDDLHIPKHMRWEFELVWPRIAPCGAVVCDDVEYAWLRFCRSRGLRSGMHHVQGLSAVRKP